MPELGEIWLPFVGGMAVLVAWRYVQRGLDWLEPRLASGAGRARGSVSRITTEHGNRVQDGLFLTLLVVLFVTLAAKREFVTLGWGVGGFVGGFALSRLGRYSRLAFGLTYTPFVIATAAYHQVQGDLPPLLYIPYVLALALGLLELVGGIGVIRVARHASR